MIEHITREHHPLMDYESKINSLTSIQKEDYFDSYFKGKQFRLLGTLLDVDKREITLSCYYYFNNRSWSISAKLKYDEDFKDVLLKCNVGDILDCTGILEQDNKRDFFYHFKLKRLEKFVGETSSQIAERAKKERENRNTTIGWVSLCVAILCAIVGGWGWLFAGIGVIVAYIAFDS